MSVDQPRPGEREDGQEGVIFISILIFLTLVAMAAAIEFPGLLGQETRARQGVGELRVQRLANGAEDLYRLSGSYPVDMAELQSGGNYPTRAKRDPFLPVQELVYLNRGDFLVVQSRGRDGVLNSPDDIIETRLNRQPARSLTRNRLRILRALVYRSEYLSPTALTAVEKVEVRNRLRTRSLSMRRRIYVARSEEKILDKAIRDDETELRKIIKKARTGRTYNRATGRNGLLGYLGLNDSRGKDGFGRDLLADDFGFSCAGRDGRKNSNDDF